MLPADWEERKDFNGKVYFLNQTGEILCNGEYTVNIIVNTRELQFTLRVDEDDVRSHQIAAQTTQWHHPGLGEEKDGRYQVLTFIPSLKY